MAGGGRGSAGGRGGRNGRPGGTLKWSALERLALYYQCTGDRSRFGDAEVITSAQIARCVDVNDTQVRRDLHGVGLRGVPHVGFNREDVLGTIRRVLALDWAHEAVIVGAGRLGKAIASYSGFLDYGLRVVALFDSDARKIGTTAGGCLVRPAKQMSSFIRKHRVSLAILTVPREAVQDCADRVVRAGVRAIWNFAPGRITVPANVAIRHERFAVGLVVLTHHLGRTG